MSWVFEQNSKLDKCLCQEFNFIGSGNTLPASIKRVIQWSADILLKYSFYFLSTSKSHGHSLVTGGAWNFRNNPKETAEINRYQAVYYFESIPQYGSDRESRQDPAL